MKRPVRTCADTHTAHALAYGYCVSLGHLQNAAGQPAQILTDHHAVLTPGSSIMNDPVLIDAKSPV